MNELIGLGSCKRTATHIITTWTNSERVYAHATPVKPIVTTARLKPAKHSSKASSTSTAPSNTYSKGVNVNES